MPFVVLIYNAFPTKEDEAVAPHAHLPDAIGRVLLYLLLKPDGPVCPIVNLGADASHCLLPFFAGVKMNCALRPEHDFSLRLQRL